MNELYQDLQKKILVGDYSGAEKLCIKIFNQQKNNINAIKNLALVKMLQNKFSSSLELYLKAYEINSDDYDVNMNLGYLYKNLEEFEIALSYLDKSINLNPERPHSYKTKAEIFMVLRDFELAHAEINKAFKTLEKNKEENQRLILEINFRKLEILNFFNYKDDLHSLINKLQSKFIHPDILIFQTIAAKESITEATIIKAEENLKNILKYSDHDRIKLSAGYYFGLANYYLSIKQYEKSEEYFVQGNERNHLLNNYRPLETQKIIKKIINAFKSLPSLDNKDNDQNIIFIVGMPRSGTTLVESIVANSNHVFSGGELDSLRLLVQHEIIGKENYDANSINALVKKYLSKMKFIKKEKKYLIDKLPFNAFLIGYIQRILPSAKIIIVDRNPWDIAVSIYQQFYYKKHFYNTSFFNIAMQIANYYYIRDYWVTQNNNNILKIEYEEVVQNTELESSKIFNFLGIDHVLNLETRKDFYSNTASYNQVKQDINKNSIKKTMFSRHREQFFIDLKEQQNYWIIDKNT